MKKMALLVGMMILGNAGLASTVGFAPSSSTGIALGSWIRNVVLTPATPADYGSQGYHGKFRADVFYNMWEMEQEGFIGGARTVDGNVMGINPLIAYGDGLETVLMVPLHTSGEGSEIDAYHFGADLTLLGNLGNVLKIGGHGNYIRTEFTSDSEEEGSGLINAGPFLSLHQSLGSASLSLGAVLNYIVPEDSEESDNITVATGAAQIGVPLGSSLAANLYGMYHYNLDTDLEDWNHFDVSADLVVALGETWLMSIGARTIIGIDALDSTEVFLGSEWGF